MLKAERARRARWGRVALMLVIAGLLALFVDAIGGRGAALLFLAAFVVTWWLVPPVADLARRLGAMSLPGGRSIARRKTPALGGAAIYFPLLLALVDAGLDGSTKAWGMAIGCTMMFLLGALDDVIRVRPRVKLAIQALAALVLVLSGFHVEALSVPGVVPVELGPFEIPFIVFWILLITNAFNLIDGMDGLAGSLAVLAGIAFFYTGTMPGAALVVAGACLGFLRHNFPRARIFMGDSGSMVLGFALGAFALQLPPENNVPLTLAILGYPIADVGLAAVRRFIRGKPMSAADRSHVHHKALEYLDNNAAWALVAILLFVASQMVFGVLYPNRVFLAVQFLMWLSLSVILVRAGQIRLSRVLAGRRSLQRLHLVRQYVGGLLGLAVRREDVELALRHMVEGLGLATFNVRDIAILNRGRHDRAAEYHVPLAGGVARWFAVPYDDETMEAERETVVTDLTRVADHRLRLLESSPTPSEDAVGQAVPETASVHGAGGGATI